MSVNTSPQRKRRTPPLSSHYFPPLCTYTIRFQCKRLETFCGVILVCLHVSHGYFPECLRHFLTTHCPFPTFYLQLAPVLTSGSASLHCGAGFLFSGVATPAELVWHLVHSPPQSNHAARFSTRDSIDALSPLENKRRPRSRHKCSNSSVCNQI